ncbi:hypothetical protein PENSPDRAFT_645679 [Peniophora sp. CONT]|nr:hypothetical protein PENSPDRAFT_645679 [Peniophora sp. CONT]
MGRLWLSSWRKTWCLAVVLLPIAAAVQLEQGFLFDWNPAGTTVPVPVTQQCDTIHITWSRSSATGPNPVAPYYLEVYTSAFIVPFLVEAGSGTSFDWQVPFAPNTLYQVCMYDSKGSTGGCQDIFTVIANTTTSTPSCANVTFPAGAMSVEAEASGAFSQYGWIPQCSDISVTPKNGTPPYTFTIAPSLLPPINLTSDSMDKISWTNTLQYGISYFISLADSEGNRWSQGPLHSSGGSSSCLDDSGTPTVAIAVGALAGGIVAGALIGGLGFWFYSRRQKRSAPSSEFLLAHNARSSQYTSSFDPSATDASLPLRPYHQQTASDRSMNSLPVSARNLPYQIEPFTLSTAPSDAQVPLLTQPGSDAPPASPGTEEARRQHVYVVHHDGGGPPVTVYTDDGAEVTELPPSYADNRAAGPRQRRQPGETPRKPRRGNTSQPSSG